MKRRLVLLVAMTMAFAAVGSSAWAQETKESAPPSTATDQPIPEPADAGPYVGQITIINGDEPVEAARPGLDLILSVQLVAQKAASDVSLTLQPAQEGLHLTETKADYNPFDPEGTAREFHFRLDESACPTDIIAFGGTVHSSEGDQPTKLAIQADCPGPRLYTQSVRYTGGDGDGVPEPGEKLEVFVTLQNQGRDPATNVTGTLKITNGDVTVVDGTSAWPDIQAAGAEESSEPFVVQIADDAKPSDCGGIAVADGGSTDVSGGGSSAGSSGEGGSNETSISPDGTVSSDGTVTVEPAGSGSAEPGSVEPQPAVVEPEPGTTEPAPDGVITEPAPEPQPSSDPSVDFSGDLTLVASGQKFHTDFFNGFACMRMAVDDQGGAALGAPVAADVAESAKTGTSGGSAVYLVVVLLAAAGSLVARYRFS